MFGRLGQDIRYALRLLGREPLVSAAIVVTLAFGIGLNTGAFTVIDGLLFQPRIRHDSSSFVEIQLQTPLASRQDYEAYAAATSLQSLAAWSPVHAGSDLPLLVTCNFFAVYAPAQPIVGRALRDEDCGAPDSSPVAVIGEQLWRNRFGSDPAIVGTIVRLNDRDFTIVGVLPREYDGQLRGPIWIPYTMASVFFGGRSIVREPATPWLLGMTGRLRPGISRAAAAAELRVIAQRQDRLVPGRETVLRVTDGSMIEAPLVRGLAVWVVPLIMGTFALVLLIALVNVAVLMLSRAVARRQEMAIRLSIGASRARLAQMLLTETLVLSAIAAPPSACLLYAVPRAFKALIPTLPYYSFAVDARIVGYLVAATILAGVIAGIAPAVESLGSESAVSAARRGSGWFASRRWRPRDLLIAWQIAMSLMLLVGAAMFLHAERKLAGNPGFETEHVLAAVPRLFLPPHTAQTAAAFYQQLDERVRGFPGVRSTAYADAPGTDAGAVRAVAFTEPDGAAAPAGISHVSPSYFATIGVGFVRGSTPGDRPNLGAVIVSESLARTLWPGRDPLGERLHLDLAPAQSLSVVGVVHDVPSLLGTAAQKTVYQVQRARTVGDALLVRFDGDERQTAAAMRDAIAGLDPHAVVEPRTLGAIRRDAADRFMRIVDIVLFLAASALALAVMGIYGAVAFAVARRMKEIGIRIALGATPGHVTGIVLWTGWKPIAVGLGTGTIVAAIAAHAVARLFRGTPAEIDPSDPRAYINVALMLASAGTAAMIAPCRRAVSAEPAHALRAD